MGSMSIGQWVLFGFLIWVGWKILKSFDSGKNGPMFCVSCGHEGPTVQKTKGSIWIEIILWLCFLVPGLIYSIWRHSSRSAVCESCGASTLVPTTSPVAQAQKKMLDRS